ncbi:MAG: hypothetical protein CSA29_04995 [Desulfobacterales bacterium]|nr:MAG: hypothetical protein CSA29_04995 [Desulfobacterales bacterium]
MLPIADVFIVIAVPDPDKDDKGGVSAFIVGKGFPGISIGNVHQSMGMHGSYKSEAIFKDTPVPAERRIGTENKGLAMALKPVDEGWMGSCHPTSFPLEFQGFINVNKSTN